MLITGCQTAYPELCSLWERATSGRKKTDLAAPLFDPLPAAMCALGTAHLNLHIRLFPYSHFPWLLNQVAAAQQDQRGYKEFACAGTAEFSKMPPFAFFGLPTDNHPAFKSSRWINNQPWWSENSQLNHLLVSVDIKSRRQLHRVHFFPLLNTSPAVWSRKHTKPKAKGERCEIVEDLAWFFAVATGCPVVRLVFDVSETHRSLQWNAYVFIAPHNSQTFQTSRWRWRFWPCFRSL